MPTNPSHVPDGYHNDVQIVATAVSVDPDNAPDIPAMIGASCALSISDIPFEGPIAGVRVGRVDGNSSSTRPLSRLRSAK